MTNNSTKSPVQGSEAETAVHLLDDWFDPIEAGLRGRVREVIQTMIESELETVLSRPRSMLAGPRRIAWVMARAVSLAAGTVTDRAHCWGPSAGWRSRCRGRLRGS